MRGILSIFVFIDTYIRVHKDNCIFIVATLHLNKWSLLILYKNFESSNLANTLTYYPHDFKLRIYV